MMKIYWRLLGFAQPIAWYAVPYAIYTLLHAFFNMFNYVMLVPVLNMIFSSGEAERVVTEKPEFSVSLQWFEDIISYSIFKVYGEDYNVVQALLLIAVILLGFSFFNNLFRYLGQRTMENMKILTLQRLRNATFDNTMNLQAGYFSNERKGDVIAKITADVQVVQFCISNTLQAVFRDPFLIIFYLLSMVAMSWELTAFSAIYLPIVAFVIGAIVKRLRKKATRGQQLYADMISTLDESVSGIKILKAYNAMDYIKDKFHRINGSYSKVTRSMAKRQQLSSPVSEFLGITALSGLLLFGGKLVMGGTLDAAVFIAFLAIFSQITRPVRSFTDAFANINQGIAAGERVLALLDTKPTITDRPGAAQMSGFEDEIRFDDVHFSYENKSVIQGVSMQIKKGQTIALVGPSGGGKSTLSDLIPRFYDVQQGSISIDDMDIRDYTLESMRQHMGIVSQDTVLFNDTVEGNLRMGKRDATMEEIQAAAKVANAHEFIMEMEEGYQTNIGDRGMKLSGGQRQRLSIARAVLKNPDILILDEATSALDTESEKLVQKALDSLLAGRTSIVIAHRLSTIRNADMIYVIEQGRIVEQGTHDQLMALEKVYHKLVSMQHMH